MTTLVLHAGSEYADGGAIQRDLLGWRDQLAALGVLLSPGSSPLEWRETAQGVLGGSLSAGARALLTTAQASDASVVLLSSDVLADALTSPDEVSALVETAAAEGVDLRVVVVVREQIGYLNSLYCRRVVTLESAKSFADFATTSVPAHRFDYVASFGAIADHDGVDLVAIPYPQLVSNGAGRAVLAAAGLSDEQLAGLPADSSGPDPVPGPVLVGASRLLRKGMRRLGMINEIGRTRLRVLTEDLGARAAAGGWDSTEFWGWDPPLRRAMAEEHADGNEMFARFVWGTPWPEPWSTGRVARADLAVLQPAIMHDVLTTVADLLTGLTENPAVLGSPRGSPGPRSGYDDLDD